jgi:uncharacterized protein
VKAEILVGLEEKIMPFNLFHKKKQSEHEQPAIPPQEEPEQKIFPESQEGQKQEVHTEIEQVPSNITKEDTKQEAVNTPQEPAISTQETAAEMTSSDLEQKQENVVPSSVEEKQVGPKPQISKTYLKAMPLRDLTDLENIKTEVQNGNIIILRVTPLASKSIEDVKIAVNDLFQFAESIGGDIARLGEERVVICPKTIRIWREKTPAPVPSEPLPSAA